MPNQKGYPKSSVNQGGSFNKVIYERVGQDIIDRINYVYDEISKDPKPFIDSKSFGEQSSKNLLFKAQMVLNYIGTRNNTIIQRQIVAK